MVPQLDLPFMPVRAISVRRPWADAIVDGVKRIENRSWRSGYRGMLLIHASSNRSLLRPGSPAMDELSRHGYSPPDGEEFFGALIGVVWMVDDLPHADVAGEPFATGPRCHVYRDALRAAEPMRWRGQQYLFSVPADVARRVLEQCESTP